MMTATWYKSSNDDKFNNNKDKVDLLLSRWSLVGYMLDHILDHIIIDLITMALQEFSSKNSLRDKCMSKFIVKLKTIK